MLLGGPARASACEYGAMHAELAWHERGAGTTPRQGEIAGMLAAGSIGVTVHPVELSPASLHKVLARPAIGKLPPSTTSVAPADFQKPGRIVRRSNSAALAAFVVPATVAQSL